MKIYYRRFGSNLPNAQAVQARMACGHLQEWWPARAADWWKPEERLCAECGKVFRELNKEPVFVTVEEIVSTN